MRSFVRAASVRHHPSILRGIVAVALAASAARAQTAQDFAKMQADLAAGRYAAVIAAANGVLETASSITTPERIQLWQLLAAAYYPPAANAQQPDSAGLPLAALIRLVPDMRIPPALSWPGLDSLTERTRAATFAVVSRPRPEYTIGQATPGRLEVVASRPTRFRMTSVDAASGRVVVHDSTGFVTRAALALRSHDADRPIFPDGRHRVDVWAVDRLSGDSVRMTHQLRATRRDRGAAADVAQADPEPPSLESLEAAAESAPARSRYAPHRTTRLWAGLVLATATVVIAQEARPQGTLRTNFRVDSRAVVVGSAMAGASLLNFFRARATVPPPPERVTVQPPPAAPSEPYRVQLVVDPAER